MSPRKASASKNQKNLDPSSQVEDYLLACTERINPTLTQHFNFDECIKIQKRFILRDLLLGLVNTVWAIPHASIKKGLDVADKLGWDIAHKVLLPRLPTAVKTGFQCEVEQRILNHIFEINTVDANLEKEIRQTVSEYCRKHNGFADVAVSGCVLLFSDVAFGDHTLDIFGIGRRIASLWAKDNASSNFFLGESVGRIFYSVAPAPAPTVSQTIISTALVLATLALLSTFINIVSWPLQRRLGLRQKQLENLIQSLSGK